MKSPCRALVCVGVLSVLSVLSVSAQALRATVPLRSPVQDKNFYLLSLLERTPEATTAVQKDSGLAGLAEGKRNAVRQSETSCKEDPTCTVDAAYLAPEEIELAGKRLEAIYSHSATLRALAAGPMRQSGLFALYRNESDESLLVHAWNDAAHGIDHILDTYGKNVRPHYYRIDSASFDMHSPEYRQRLHAMVGMLPPDRETLFFQPSLRFALMLLDANHRDEAGRFEPMESGVNAEAVQHLAGIAWKDYPYSAIAVLGVGPEDPAIALSPEGRANCARAAELFRQGKAPVIITSGGFVHPSQTRFSEAIEMKRALVEDFGIPANAVLVDPHARHTTTNFRNVDRLIYRYGMPLDKPALAVAMPKAIPIILSSAFDDRNRKELGYLPYRDIKPVSPTEVSFFPVIEALQGDARDPLDP